MDFASGIGTGIGIAVLAMIIFIAGFSLGTSYEHDNPRQEVPQQKDGDA